MISRALMWLLILTTTPLTRLRDRAARARTAMREQPEAGYASETIVVTALLIAAAIVVIGTIIAKVTAKANSIDLGP